MIPTSDKREAAFADDLSVHPTKLSIRIAPYNRWATSAVRPGFYLIRDLNAAKGGFFGVQHAAAVRTSTVGMRLAYTQPPVSEATVPRKAQELR